MRASYLPTSIAILSLIGIILYSVGLLYTSAGRTGFTRGRVSLNVFYMPSYVKIGRLMLGMSFQAVVYTFALPLATAYAALLPADRRLKPSFIAFITVSSMLLAASAYLMKLPNPVVKEIGSYIFLQLPSSPWILPLLLAHISLSIAAYKLMPEGKLGSTVAPLASMALLLLTLITFAPLAEKKLNGVEVRVPRASYTKLAEALAKIALYPVYIAGRLECSTIGLAARYIALLTAIPAWMLTARALLAAYWHRKARQRAQQPS